MPIQFRAGPILAPAIKIYGIREYSKTPGSNELWPSLSPFGTRFLGACRERVYFNPKTVAGWAEGRRCIPYKVVIELDRARRRPDRPSLESPFVEHDIFKEPEFEFEGDFATAEKEA